MSKRLGRGLDALIPSLTVTEEDKVIEIALDELRPNPYQPRKNFDEESIKELAASIKEHGVIQPIIVRNVLKGYEIIAGERRWRAAKMCGLSTIPAVVRSFTDQQVTEIALIENLQREDLNPIEVATAYQALMERFNLTQEELSVKVGKSRSHIANFLRLLHLPEEVKEHVSRGTISMGHARAIAAVKDKKMQKELAEKAIREQWSVRQIEAEIQRLEAGNKGNTGPKKKLKWKTNVFIKEQEEQLRELLKTNVKIKDTNYKGKIEIMYYSKEDLERIIQCFQEKTV